MPRPWNPGKLSRFETQKRDRFDRSRDPLREFCGSYLPKFYHEKFTSLAKVEAFVNSVGYKLTEINHANHYVVADFEFRVHVNGYVSRETYLTGAREHIQTDNQQNETDSKKTKP